MSIQSQIDRLENTKYILRAVIEYKGVPVPEETKLDEMPALVAEIPQGLDTSDATAVAEDIVLGKTAYADGQKITGNMTVVEEDFHLEDAIPSWDAERQSISTSFYANGGRVAIDENVGVYLHLDGTELGDAEDADVTAGKTYTSAGGLKRTGTKQEPAAVAQATPTISVSSGGLITASATQTAGYVSSGTKSATKQLSALAARTWTPGTTSIGIPAGNYLTGAQTIKGDSNLLAANIRKGISIFGVAGNYEGSGSSGGSGGLPSGISALASGTYTPTQDYTSRVDVAHGLGVKPNFCIVMVEDDFSGAVQTSMLVGASVFYKKAKYTSTSTIVYSAHIMMEGYNASSQSSGTASRAASDAYFTTSTFGIPCNSTYKLKTGYTYRWICGAMEGIG